MKLSCKLRSPMKAFWFLLTRSSSFGAERSDKTLAATLPMRCTRLIGWKSAQFLRLLVLRQQSEQRLVELAKAPASQIIELQENREDVMFDQGPTCLQEFRGVSIRPRRLAGRQPLNHGPNLSFGERLVELRKVRRRGDQLLQVEGAVTPRLHAQHAVKMSEGSLSHLCWLVQHTIVHEEVVDAIFLVAIRALTMKKAMLASPPFRKAILAPWRAIVRSREA